jgi:hypothetical protein
LVKMLMNWASRCAGCEHLWRDTLTDEVEINLNMLDALMLDIVGGKVDHTNVVCGRVE